MSKGPGVAPSSNQRNNSQNNKRQNTSDNNYQIHVGDLDPTVSKQQLIDHFRKKFHSVIDGKIIMDQSTKISKGYGFIIFSSYEEFQRAMTEMQGTFIKGKPIKVSQGIFRNNGNNQGSGFSRNSNTNNATNSMTNNSYGSSGMIRLI